MENHRGEVIHRRNGFRKQIIETKEGPWELRVRKIKVTKRRGKDKRKEGKPPQGPQKVE